MLIQNPPNEDNDVAAKVLPMDISLLFSLTNDEKLSG
jgi:hypothetical protein